MIVSQGFNSARTPIESSGALASLLLGGGRLPFVNGASMAAVPSADSINAIARTKLAADDSLARGILAAAQGIAKGLQDRSNKIYKDRKDKEDRKNTLEDAEFDYAKKKELLKMQHDAIREQYKERQHRPLSVSKALQERLAEEQMKRLDFLDKTPEEQQAEIQAAADRAQKSTSSFDPDDPYANASDASDIPGGEGVVLDNSIIPAITEQETRQKNVAVAPSAVQSFNSSSQNSSPQSKNQFLEDFNFQNLNSQIEPDDMPPDDFGVSDDSDSASDQGALQDLDVSMMPLPEQLPLAASPPQVPNRPQTVRHAGILWTKDESTGKWQPVAESDASAPLSAQSLRDSGLVPTRMNVKRPDGTTVTYEVPKNGKSSLSGLSIPEGLNVEMPDSLAVKSGKLKDGSVEFDLQPEDAALDYEKNRGALMKALNDAQVTIDSVSDIERLSKEGILPNTGKFATWLAMLPVSTGANDIKQLLKSVTANVAFKALADIRNSSKTGGGLGAISDKENELLAAAEGAIDQSLSPELFMKNLIKIKKAREDYVALIQEKIKAAEVRRNAKTSNKELASLRATYEAGKAKLINMDLGTKEREDMLNELAKIMIRINELSPVADK